VNPPIVTARPSSSHRVPFIPVPVVGAGVTRRQASIDQIIDQGLVQTLFQPVVHIASQTVAGYEALSRGPIGSDLESPMALLDAARSVGRLGELDWLCRTKSTQAAARAHLHRDLSWLINVEPAGLSSDCPEHLKPALLRSRKRLRIILEVVERDVEGYATALIKATDQARRDSWGVALDDVGAEEGSLALLPFLRPDVVKLDMSLVQSAPRSAAAAITGAVHAYAERTGAVILAEGIETLEQERLAQVFGATYGQGFHYGRPGPLPLTLPMPLHVIPRRSGLAPLCGGSPFEVLSRRLSPLRAPKSDLTHISRHLETQSGQGSGASVLLASFQDVKFFGPATQRRYERLSASNALTVVLARGLPVRTEPRYQQAATNFGSALASEWVVIVVKPHYAVAFVARDCGDTGPDSERRFDFIYTHDRDAVVAAARSFLQAVPPDGS